MRSTPNETDRPVYEPVYRDPNLRILFCVTLIAVLGVSSVTPVFPTMQKALGITPQATSLLVTVFTLPGVIATPLIGVLSDRVGRKRLLVPSLFLFAFAGASLPLAPTFTGMLALRFVQGLGAAALGSLNVTIIGDLYRGRLTTAAMGYNAGVLSLGTTLYPLLGGALAALGWRYPFYLPLLAIPVALLAWFRLETPPIPAHQDMRSYLLDALASISNRRMAGLFFASLASFVLLYGAYSTYLPFLLAESFQGTSTVIGLVMSSMSLATAVVASQLSRLSRRFLEQQLIVAAFLLHALALLMIPHVPSLWLFLIPTTIYGLGQGLNTPSIQSLLARMAPPQQRGAFMSLNGMVFRLGQTLGPLLMGLAFTAWGFTGVYRAGAVLGVVAAVLVGAALGSDRHSPG